jgi:hypothetical protein
MWAIGVSSGNSGVGSKSSFIARCQGLHRPYRLVCHHGRKHGRLGLGVDLLAGRAGRVIGGTRDPKTNRTSKAKFHTVSAAKQS